MRVDARGRQLALTTHENRFGGRGARAASRGPSEAGGCERTRVAAEADKLAQPIVHKFGGRGARAASTGPAKRGSRAMRVDARGRQLTLTTHENVSEAEARERRAGAPRSGDRRRCE